MIEDDPGSTPLLGEFSPLASIDDLRPTSGPFRTAITRFASISRYPYMKRVLLVVLVIGLLASCTSSRSAYKCNGKKGTHVPMGVL